MQYMWINITTPEGEVLERFAIQTDRAELPLLEQARRVEHYISLRYDVIEVPQ